jgi:ubiquinone/menaquinone biosynthesis C-methylase UbiE
MSLLQQRYSLVCPQCKSANLVFLTDLIQCSACKTSFIQEDDDWLNLMPDRIDLDRDERWQERLIEMEDWYQDLNSDLEAANSCFLADYTPYTPVLTSISGDVLDLGGGIGLPRHYLPTKAKYTVLDPSVKWLKTDWSSLSDSFPCLQQKPDFIRGVGEHLPFLPQSFDAVLSFWSLNHASNPKLVFSEVDRVLRQNGKFLIVLEDTIPKWVDLINPMFPAKKVLNSFYPKLWQQKQLFPRFDIFTKLLKDEQWPLQTDHIRILESEIDEWIEGKFKIRSRSWLGHYLTFEMTKSIPV